MNKCALFLILVICSCKDDPCILLDPIYTYQVQVLDASGDDLLFGHQSIYSLNSINKCNGAAVDFEEGPAFLLLA